MSYNLDGDDDDLRLGVVRTTMVNNPLIKKAPVGKAKTNSQMPSDFVFGIKSKKHDGGTAAALGKDRLPTPIESEAHRRFKERNPLFRKAEVGHHKAPNNAVESMVHGKKSVKEKGVSESLSSWYEPSVDNTQKRRPDVGRAVPPLNPETANIVHGIKHEKKDGGTAEVLSGWLGGDRAVKPTSNPLLLKAEVGHAKHADPNLTEKVWGKKSADPSIQGGVSKALGDWDRPDTTNANKSSSTVRYKPELGRARPPLKEGTEEIVHGKKNVKKDGGTSEALSNWRPTTPKTHQKVHYTVDKNRSFGKPSQGNEPMAELMNNSYGKQWLREQVEKHKSEWEQKQTAPPPQ